MSKYVLTAEKALEIYGKPKSIIEIDDFYDELLETIDDEYRQWCSDMGKLAHKYKDRGMYNKTHSKESIEKMSLAKVGKKRTIESRNKQSESVTGNKNHFYGKTHSNEFKLKQSIRQKEKQMGGNNNNAKTIFYQDKVYATMKDMVKETGISAYNIRKLIAANKAEII